MKKHWKIALAAATVAALVPYSYKKDKEAGASVLQALLWSCTKKSDGDTQILIGLHLGAMPLPKTSDEDLEPCFEDETTGDAEELSAEPEEASTEPL